MTRLNFPSSPPKELATIGDWWRFTFTSLVNNNAQFGQGTMGPADDASFLVLGSLGLPLDAFDTFKAYALTGEEKAVLFDRVQKRCIEHVPTAYLLGFTDQHGYRFAVNESVLIPRSFLGELLTDGLAPWLEDAEGEFALLDLCTGSGCLAIIAAHEFPNATIAASDVSADALTVAEENIEAHALDQAIDLREGDLFAPWAGERFDVIVSNPPYVTDESMADLPREFAREPALALAAGEDGCDVLRRLLAEAHQYLTREGLLFVDIGNNRLLVEAAFPHLPFTWLDTEGAEGGVFMLRADALAKPSARKGGA